jgi:hypothetical protein
MKWAVFLLLAGCGAQHKALELSPRAFDDADVRAEVALHDGLTLRLHNKTDEPLHVRWEDVAVVGADHRLTPLFPRGSLEPLAPGARFETPLHPWARPRRGAKIELIVPTVVRGVPREYHFHLHVS